MRNLLGHSLQYNYYDYMDTWFKIVLYQNKSYSHSWFFSFDKHFKSTSIPSWFLRWWKQYGAINELIPSDLMDQVNYFSNSYKVNSHMSQFPKLVIFMSKYKESWKFK